LIDSFVANKNHCEAGVEQNKTFVSNDKQKHK